MSELRLFFLKYQHRLAGPFLLYPPIQNQMLIWRSAAQGPNPFLKSLFSASFKSWGPPPQYILFYCTSYFVHPICSTSYFQCFRFFRFRSCICGSLYQCILFKYISFLVLPIFEVPDPKYEVPNVGISYVRCFLLLCSYLYVFLSVCYS